MNFPLRKTIYVTVICISIILIGVLTLGFRQYQHLDDYGKVILQSEKLLFQFGIIREHINELLVEGDYSTFSGIVKEIEDLHSNLASILANKNIPDEYKLSFVNQVDLPGIALLIRNINGQDVDKDKLRELNREIRVLGDRLMLFDRVIVNHAKRRLINFQSVVIGALAIVIFIIVNVLYLFHRRIAAPLLILDQQVKEVSAGKRENVSLQFVKKSAEINELANSFSNLLLTRKKTSEGLDKKHRTIQAVQSIIYSIAHAQNQKELLKEICRSLLANDGYCVVTISTPSLNKTLLPAAQETSFPAAKGNTDEHLKLLMHTLEGRGAEKNPELKAFQAGHPVIERNLLAGIPKGILAHTPFEGISLSCAALPLTIKGYTFGVLTVYKSSTDTFEEEEIDLLTIVSGELAMALKTFEIKEDLDLKETVKNQLIDAFDAILVAFSEDGTIISLNPKAEKIFGYSSDDMIGKPWLDFFKPLEDSMLPAKEKGIYYLPAFISSKHYEMDIFNNKGEKKTLSCRFTDCLNRYAEEGDVLCIAQDISGSKRQLEDLAVQLKEEKNRKMETVRCTRLASLGELTTGISHEISNLSNGIINYAQLLSDETGETILANGQLNLLDNIIKEGERIAEIAQKLLFYSREEGGGNTLVRVDEVIEDSLLLIKHNLKNDGIKVQTAYPDTMPAISLHLQQMQLVFLNIFHNARRALNQKYPMKNDNKRLEVKGDLITRDGKRWIVFTITDWGEGISSENLPLVFDPGYTTKPPGEGNGMGLAIARDIVVEHGGNIEITSQFGDHTTVVVELPVS